ncbi:unnamed protein product [Chironomus riparius]|uniref:Uncharacterized protein n=1 Tax=Chironomus riparius TaxID=315576 RepID=A0A9N9WNX0_9DIPT|nr:unnamed protein product [Chironomus riparius]
MSLKFIYFVCVCVIIFYTTSAQILYCTFRNDSTYGYTCDIYILNPTGNYNFSRVLGSHFTGKTDQDVRFIKRSDNSNTTNVPYIICETFQNAIWFDLQSIRISRLDENTFWGCKSLKYLYLNNNLLTTLPPYLFSVHPSSHINEALTLPWDMFSSHLQSLEILNLSNNQIEEILPLTFNSLINLKSLYLHYNLVEEVQPETFSSLNNLVTLNFNYNKIIKLVPKSFESLVHLTSLYLDHNQIEEIQPDIFSPLINLKTLDLFKNQIEELLPKTFKSLISLSELYLSSNNISRIYYDSFESLEKLLILQLQYNQIDELPRNFISSSKQLPKIDLNNNKLKVIHSFGVLPKLITVNLQNNQIDAFDQDLIDDTGVVTLDMRNNSCANFVITDRTSLRLDMRMKLLNCFSNYGNLPPESTTAPTTVSTTTESTTTALTLPPGCIEGNFFFFILIALYCIY